MAESSDTTNYPDRAGDPRVPCAQLSCTVDMEALRALSMKELADVRDVMHVVGAVLSGLICQPRFTESSDRCCHNRAWHAAGGSCGLVEPLRALCRQCRGGGGADCRQ